MIELHGAFHFLNDFANCFECSHVSNDKFKFVSIVKLIQTTELSVLDVNGAMSPKSILVNVELVPLKMTLIF